MIRRWMLRWFPAWIGFALVAADSPDLPRWWRGNLHTHTLWSDGDAFPEMAIEWYKSHGYQFLALSDHNVLLQGEHWITLSEVARRAKGEPWRGAGHQATDAFGAYLAQFGSHWVETRLHPTNGEVQVRLKSLEECRALYEEAGRFQMIPAEELTHQSRDGHAIHLGVINLLEALRPRDGATVRETIRTNLQAALESAGRSAREVLIHVNHPNYKWGVTAEDLAAVVEEPFFEVWNGVETDNDPGDALHPATDEIWDIANTLRLAGLHAPPLYGLANDDTHDYQGTKRRALPGRAWVWVRARRLTPDSLVRAMRAGEFYASTGVVLGDVRYDAAALTLSLRIEPHAGERFITRFIGTRRGVSLEGRPRRDATGRVVETTLDYRTAAGPQIGEVLAEVRGLHPGYRFRGDELYVRAVVQSSAHTDVPSTEHEFKRAWTQPVGWRLDPAPSP